MTADYIHNPVFWRAGWETIAHTLGHLEFWWLFSPMIAGLLVLGAARLLPQWRRLRLTLCIVAFLACASLAWDTATATFTSPWGARMIGLGTAIMLIAILMHAAGQEEG